MFKKDKKQEGFTLLEIITVIAITSIIATISIVSWRSFSDTTNLGNTAKMIETKIKLAKSYSLSAVNDVNYGVHLEAESITLFPADAAYVLSDPDNQVFALTDGIEIYNGVDNSIIFNRLTGSTANSGTIGIRVKSNPSRIKTITINSQGQTGIDSFEASAVPAIVEDTTNNINARHIHYILQGWSITPSSSITKLIFRKNDGVPGTLIDTEIDTAPFFNIDGLFDWQGTITIDGVAQKLRIHTLDATGGTVCVKRDRMQNSKDIKISFFDNGLSQEKLIVTYIENVGGTVTVVPNTPVWVALGGMLAQ